MKYVHQVLHTSVAYLDYTSTANFFGWVPYNIISTTFAILHKLVQQTLTAGVLRRVVVTRGLPAAHMTRTPQEGKAVPVCSAALAFGGVDGLAAAALAPGGIEVKRVLTAQGVRLSQWVIGHLPTALCSMLFLRISVRRRNRKKVKKGFGFVDSL